MADRRGTAAAAPTLDAEAARSWTGCIHAVVPSDNVQRRWHWSRLKREQEVWLMLIRAALPRVPPATGVRRVTITRHSPGLLDTDNLSGAHKALVRDLLRPAKLDFGLYASGPKRGAPWSRESLGLGLILGDGPGQAIFHYDQVRLKRGLQPYTVITIEEVPHG